MYGQNNTIVRMIVYSSEHVYTIIGYSVAINMLLLNLFNIHFLGHHDFWPKHTETRVVSLYLQLLYNHTLLNNSNSIGIVHIETRDRVLL